MTEQETETWSKYVKEVRSSLQLQVFVNDFEKKKQKRGHRYSSCVNRVPLTHMMAAYSIHELSDFGPRRFDVGRT